VSVRPIVLLGDPRLRIKGQPVESFGRFLHGLLDDLAHTMRAAPGVGLAAPQIGEALAVCVVEIEESTRVLEPDIELVISFYPLPQASEFYD
jgi:peptide deformylase